VVLPDGRILIAGASTIVGGKKQNYIARLNPDGSFDATFDAALGPDDWVRALAVQADGAVNGGMFTAVNGQPRYYLARLRSDGTRPTFAAPTRWCHDGIAGTSCFLNEHLKGLDEPMPTRADHPRVTNVRQK